MMPRINAITISVRLGRDVARKELGGKPVAECSGAFDIGFGERKTTGWLDVQLWGRTSEMFADDCSKGDEVVLTGRLETRKWDGRDGERQTWTIVASDYLLVRGRPEQPESRTEPESGYSGARPSSSEPVGDDDDPGPSW